MKDDFQIHESRGLNRSKICGYPNVPHAISSKLISMFFSKYTKLHMSYNYHSTWFSNLIIIYAKNRALDFMYVCMYIKQTTSVLISKLYIDIDIYYRND